MSAVLVDILLIIMLAAGTGGVRYYSRVIKDDMGDLGMINTFGLICSAALAAFSLIVLIKLYLSGEI
jgi:hypothetical protein